MNLKKNLNIATILPYKENFTFGKASAASLWVSEFFKKSKHKKNNIIYGHTKSKDYLNKNYKNINLKNLKSKLKSTTKEYAEKLTIELKNKNFDIVEVHNRPLLLFKLTKKDDCSPTVLDAVNPRLALSVLSYLADPNSTTLSELICVLVFETLFTLSA